MRMSFDVTETRTVAEVVLSRRNLLAFLHKLDMPGSARTIQSNDAPEGFMLRVRCEDDDEHYGRRPFPPGPMHPDTEEFIRGR